MPVMQSPPGTTTIFDGRSYLYFAGTGYLGLQGHPDVIRAACRGAEQFGIGSATSRNRVGSTPPLLEAERLTAELFGTDDSFYFASGYMSPAVVLSMLHGRFDAVLLDELAHYCLEEAAARLGCPVLRFAHCRPESLEDHMKRLPSPGARVLVMTDGVFASLGRLSPVADYWQLLAQRPGSMLLVDDAHGYGVVGEHGRGVLEHAGLWSREINSHWPSSGDDRPALWTCGTLSKALGGFGGIVPGSSAVIDALKNRSPYGSGASAPAVPAAAGSAEALRIVLAQPELLTRLRANVTRLRTGLRGLGLDVDDSPAAVVAVQLDTAAAMCRVQEGLAERGIWIAYVPTYSGVGPEGLLRLAVFATHTSAMIDQLLAELAPLL
ncbi:MAG: aminotransferase class I/II-fold pyridoxal phosphate-dependent enzyme [Thermoguttaceae bacterium]